MLSSYFDTCANIKPQLIQRVHLSILQRRLDTQAGYIKSRLLAGAESAFMFSKLRLLVCSVVTATMVSGTGFASAQGIFETGSLYGSVLKGAPQGGFNAGIGAGRCGQNINNIISPGSGGRGGGGGGSSARGQGGAGQIDPLVAAQAARQANAFYEQARQKEKGGKLDEATKLYNQCLSVRQSVWGDRDPAIGQILNTMARLYRKQGKLSDAESTYRKLLADSVHKNGPGSAESCPVLSLLGDICAEEKKFGDACSFYNQLLALRLRKLGEDHPDTLSARMSLASALANLGKYQDAEPLLKAALSSRDSAGDKGSAQLLSILEAYSGVLRETDRSAEAEQLESRAQAIRASRAPAADTATAVKAADTTAAVKAADAAAAAGKEAGAPPADARPEASASGQPAPSQKADTPDKPPVAPAAAAPANESDRSASGQATAATQPAAANSGSSN